MGTELDSSPGLCNYTAIQCLCAGLPGSWGRNSWTVSSRYWCGEGTLHSPPPTNTRTQTHVYTPLPAAAHCGHVVPVRWPSVGAGKYFIMLHRVVGCRNKRCSPVVAELHEWNKAMHEGCPLRNTFIWKTKWVSPVWVQISSSLCSLVSGSMLKQ